MILTAKQTQALDLLEDNITKELGYGGAAGGGKTQLGCYWQLKNRLKYPGSRGLIGRAVLKTLKETTLSTFFEVAKRQGVIRGIHFDLTGSNDKEFPNCLVFANGSLIYLKDLFQYPSDKDFDEFGSLEITDGFIDEAAQVVKKCKDIITSRMRYKLDEFGLIPKLLWTANPCKGWPYVEFYKAQKERTLPEYRNFVAALPKDNPHLPESYLKTLLNLPLAQRERLYYGNWMYDDNPAVLCDYDAICDAFTNDHVIATEERYGSADLAMQGRDRFVVGSWRGMVVDIRIDKPLATGKSIEQDLKQLMITDSIPHSQMVADSDGLGNYLESYLEGIKSFHGGSQAINKDDFANLKSECGFKLAEYINKREIKIICSQEQKERIAEELGCLQIADIDADETRKRLIKKEKMKEILNGRSPDYLDMLLMKMIFHVQPQWDVIMA